MSKDKAKSLSDLIAADDSGLAKLAVAARLRSDLSEHMRNNLGEPLSNGIMHCNVHDDGTLIVIAANPEWASRLRFEAPKLLALCTDFGAAATAVKVRVAG